VTTDDYAQPLQRLWDQGAALWYSYGDLAKALLCLYGASRFNGRMAAQQASQLLKDVFRNHGVPNRARQADGTPGDTDDPAYRAYRHLAAELFERERLGTWDEPWPTYRRLTVDQLVQIMRAAD